MRLPLEIAMEVGSFLDRPCVTVCTTQLCRNVVGFVSRPCTDRSKVTTIHLHKLVTLCRTASEASVVDQEQANGLSTEAIKRINLCLARRTSAEKVVFNVKLKGANARANADFYSDIHRHFQVGSNLQFNNGPSLAVQWHARAKSIDAVVFLLGQSLYTLDLSYIYSAVNDISALASCQALHTLNLAYTDVSDVSALASCQALHTLDLAYTQVSDVSALVSCQALHTLLLTSTRVNDVSALASCQALHTIDLSNTHVYNVSALASCQALHTLDLSDTYVSDVSALASCQALHTLHLNNTHVYNISALVACGSLRHLHGCERMLGYEAVARLIENRRLLAQGV